MRDLGKENGTRIGGTWHALLSLEEDFPADVEILLAYGKRLIGKLPWRQRNGNPFGHICIRVGKKLFSVNDYAVRSVGDTLIHETNLDEYLYGTTRTYINEESTGTFGQAYGRDNLSLRVKGIPELKQRMMEEEVQLINEEFRRGHIRFRLISFNCCDFVKRVLKAAGYCVVGDQRKSWIQMPLDCFEECLEFFARHPRCSIAFVYYAYIPDSANSFVPLGFPFSIYQPGRCLGNLFLRRVDELETRIEGRIISQPGSLKVTYII